ncbi:hypothetical protein PN466_14885 [Roseofilum reptotaenium CS-1145]|uniref:Uncharacterized protein n=1 Tax=Roseofilum reptotaenium AO1-A TaxID=1925591 RepID=A0A1L9QT49_9CYAN|nr:hypothetical protein [Roseofilum reptotaenium]MDB9518232.1 hypothetical protein [Roseofilum reptotaenium CS-1145]OJJ25819.1 hypothetical protein BI308_09910 [Roseofilum reptotaenium AO1-A]
MDYPPSNLYRLWFCTPFFTRNVRVNSYHQFFRWSSVVVGLVSGGACLSSSIILSGLEPKIKALEKYDVAQFKHSVASELFLAQQTNSAIALAVSTERKSSLGLTDPNASIDEDYEGVPLERSLPPNSEGSNETNGLTEQVRIALNDGLPDSEIIKNVMGYKGAKYAEGRAKLEQIKSSLESPEEDEQGIT